MYTAPPQRGPHLCLPSSSATPLAPSSVAGSADVLTTSRHALCVSWVLVCLQHRACRRLPLLLPVLPPQSLLCWSCWISGQSSLCPWPTWTHGSPSSCRLTPAATHPHRSLCGSLCLLASAHMEARSLSLGCRKATQPIPGLQPLLLLPQTHLHHLHVCCWSFVGYWQLWGLLVDLRAVDSLLRADGYSSGAPRLLASAAGV